jgi:peptidoglycan/xylan/chitin deacetylase (PgdA/CDA1 family)
MTKSKEALENITGRPVRFLSYPFGSQHDFTQDTAALARECGFKAGIANIQGRIAIPMDRYRVPRRLVRDWPQETFARWLVEPGLSRPVEKETMKARNIRLLMRLDGASKDAGTYQRGQNA